LKQSVPRIPANGRRSVHHRVFLFFRRRDLVCVFGPHRQRRGYVKVQEQNFRPHGDCKLVTDDTSRFRSFLQCATRKFLPRDTEIKKTNLKLTTYSKINLKGLVVAKISLRNPKNRKKYRAEFAIIAEDYTPLLGSSAAQQLGLITVQQDNILQVKESY